MGLPSKQKDEITYPLFRDNSGYEVKIRYNKDTYYRVSESLMRCKALSRAALALLKSISSAFSCDKRC
jgi:hypothetical protein